MKKALIILSVFVLTLFMLVGCQKTITVTFDTDGGSAVEAVTLKSGESISLLPTPTKDNYDFKGWYSDSEKSQEFSNQAISENITVYAKWELKTYTVTFIAGLSTATAKVKHGETVVCPVTPVNPGHTFTGWDKSLENITSSVTITALFDVDVFDVKFMVDGVQFGETQKIEYGKSATAPATNPTKDGFTFKAWDTDLTNIRTNVVINAIFSVNTYNVSFYNGDELIGTVQEVEYGKGAEAPKAPTKDGHNFIRWDTDFSNIKGDTVVKAVFEAIIYDVKFMVEGVQYGEIQAIEYGKSATKPVDPTKENFTFKGWDTDFSVVSSNLTCNAIFERESYNVKFMVNNDQYGDIQKVKVGGAATKPVDPTKQYYTFKGWDIDFSNVTSDLVCNAVFEATEYDIKYYNGTTELTDVSLKKYKPSENTDLPGYRKSGDKYFIGWHKASDLSDEPVGTIGIGSEGEVKLYAAFAELDFNGGVLTWDFTGFTTAAPAAKGINAVSNLPEMFEADFYQYLKNNNLLSSLDWKEGEAATWAKFSGVNPNHGSDPYKIWNDTSSALSGGTPGYCKYLYDTAVCSEDGTLTSIVGGFLGTEPYRTKYINLSKQLSLMVHQRYQSNYMSDSGTDSKALVAFIIDGYFYGTQGLTGSTVAAGFKPLRENVPTPTTTYVLDGTTAKAVTVAYEVVCGGTGWDQNTILPMREGYYFAGWATSPEGTALTSGATVGSTITKLYALWIQVA